MFDLQDMLDDSEKDSLTGDIEIMQLVSFVGQPHDGQVSLAGSFSPRELRKLARYVELHS